MIPAAIRLYASNQTEINIVHKIITSFNIFEMNRIHTTYIQIPQKINTHNIQHKNTHIINTIKSQYYVPCIVLKPPSLLLLLLTT
jgi:hypothetical protein